MWLLLMDRASASCLMLISTASQPIVGGVDGGGTWTLMDNEGGME